MPEQQKQLAELIEQLKIKIDSIKGTQTILGPTESLKNILRYLTMRDPEYMNRALLDVLREHPEIAKEAFELLLGLGVLREHPEVAKEAELIELIKIATNILQMQLQYIEMIKHERQYLEEFHTHVERIKLSLEEELKNQQKVFKEDVLPYLMTSSLSLDSKDIKLHRFIPVVIYIRQFHSPDDPERVSGALCTFMGTVGFEKITDYPAERRSWFKRFILRSKETLTYPEVQERLKKVERTLELATLQKYQADVDEKQARAASALIEALKDIPTATCKLGSILLLKTTRNGESHICMRSLSPIEMIYLERNQDSLKDPNTILDVLGKQCGSAEVV